jgi:Methyltransferase domain
MMQTWGRTTTSAALKPVINRLDRRIERLARNRAQQVVRDDVGDVRGELAKMRAELDELRSHRFALELLLGPQGRRSSRLISQPALRQLAAQVQLVTGEEHAYTRLVQTYRMLFELELRGVGRLAGGTRNILGKLATTPLLRPPNGEVLEVGTLYGVFSGGMARQINRIGLEYQLTVVDPLAAIQLQVVGLKPDASGSPVTETVVRANLALAGVEPDRYRLIQGFSGDAQVQATISDRDYGVMIIDGDHSAEGVAVDLQLAEKIVAGGGIVVLDDYGDTNWPGVEQAVTAHLSRPTRFTLIGAVATSAFLRAD